MDNGQDKRKHPRWDVDKKVFCYIDGARLDARSSNISLGGMFIRTDGAERVPLDSLVGLVFRASTPDQGTTFLFGRVVRKQDFPEAGLGLHWEKAVAVTPPEALAAFLKNLMGIENLTIIQEATGPEGRVKSIFWFDSIGVEPMNAERPPPVPEDRTPVQSLATTAPPYVEEGSKLPHSQESGAITTMVNRKDLRAPTSQLGILSVAGADLEVEITSIGIDGAMVDTGPLTLATGTEACLRFEIKTRAGVIPVTCNCRSGTVADSQSAGTANLDLEFTEVLEGDHEDVLRRYVKWLHFNNLAGD